MAIGASTKTLQFDPASNEWKLIEGITESSVTITDPLKGLVINSTTKQWRLTVTDAGVLVITQIV